MSPMYEVQHQHTTHNQPGTGQPLLAPCLVRLLTFFYVGLCYWWNFPVWLSGSAHGKDCMGESLRGSSYRHCEADAFVLVVAPLLLAHEGLPIGYVVGSQLAGVDSSMLRQLRHDPRGCAAGGCAYSCMHAA